jgi:hypothetical protein
MKTAIGLFGHIRTHKNCGGCLSQLINKFDADLFIHTWDTYGFSTNTGGDNIEPLWDSGIIDFSLLNLLPNIKKCVIETKSEVMPEIYKLSIKYEDKKLAPVDRPSNIISCLRKIFLVNRLIRDYSSEHNVIYDKVILIRPDLKYDTGIFENDEKNLLNYNDMFTSNECAAHISCYGTPDIVSQYTEIYNNLDFLVDNDVKFNPHLLDKQYFALTKLNTKGFSGISIVR